MGRRKEDTCLVLVVVVVVACVSPLENLPFSPTLAVCAAESGNERDVRDVKGEF